MRGCIFGWCVALGAFASPSAQGAVNGAYATEVISYVAGDGASPAYLDPESALGEPTRFTAAGTEFPSVVSPFSPPYWINEIVSIGAGGSLVVKFDFPIENNPNNLYGIDLIVFGNVGFIDIDYPNGHVGGMFGDDGGSVEVSADGNAWQHVKGVAANAMAPTLGYLDSGPFDEEPGTILADFARPVDPRLGLSHFMGLMHAQVVAKYRGSGGGVGVDIAGTGLSQVSYVRITNPTNAEATVEIDGLSRVSPRRAGDANLDGVVNVADLLMVISGWGVHMPGDAPSDFNNDGLVNVSDLLSVITNWG